MSTYVFRSLQNANFPPLPEAVKPFLHFDSVMIVDPTPGSVLITVTLPSHMKGEVILPARGKVIVARTASLGSLEARTLWEDQTLLSTAWEVPLPNPIDGGLEAPPATKTVILDTRRLYRSTDVDGLAADIVLLEEFPSGD